MPVLYRDANPGLYADVEDRNVRQQFVLLRTCVMVALDNPSYRFTADVILALHQAAAFFFDHFPGRYRDDHVHIDGSSHIPPDHREVPGNMRDFLIYLNANMSSADPYELAAFALWRLTWIHPFFECNGRTARAWCYLVLCVKLGRWLPGRYTIINMMKETRERTYGLLAGCDEAFKSTSTFVLEPLARYLKDLVAAQVEAEL